jgi:hydroxypyruvate isomerase
MKYVVNCSILLTELPLRQRPAAARAAGFDAVEFWWPFDVARPDDAVVAAFERALQDHGLQLTGLNLFSGDGTAGERGLLSDATRSRDLRDNLDVVTGIGERTGCRAFNALYGARLSGLTSAQQDEVAVEQLVVAAAAVDRVDGVVLLEPRSGTDGYALRSSAHAVELIARARACGAHNVRLLADLYHLAELDEDVPDVISNAFSEIGHVQIADSPGRGAPGTGRLPLSAWLSLCETNGYDAYVGLEYQSPAADAFTWLDPSLRGSSSA